MVFAICYFMCLVTNKTKQKFNENPIEQWDVIKCITQTYKQLGEINRNGNMDSRVKRLTCSLTKILFNFIFLLKMKILGAILHETFVMRHSL